MKIIALDKAIKILQSTNAVVWEDSYLAFPFVVDDEEDKCFLYLNMLDDDGRQISVEFLVKDNQFVEISGYRMTLINKKQQKIKLSILTFRNLEA